MVIADFRSDTVTRPSPAMRKAMVDAEVGDDVYGDDPTVNQFERLAADMLGTEAAVLVPSGTQSNLIALLTHCQRGDEYIAGDDAHTYKFEGGGAAVLGGIQPQTVAFGENGILPLDRIRAVVKPDDNHFARTRLLTLENTQHGRVLPLDYIVDATQLASELGLARHLDGARVFNAAAVLQQPVTAISQHFDTISVCLSKGLGAPLGSVLCGPAGFIDEARRWRKVCGGGMRQAGIFAAAGMIALEQGVKRLSVDHENAHLLADQLRDIDEVEVRQDWLQTNMVWLRFVQPGGAALSEFMKEKGVLITSYDDSCRLVTHADVGAEEVRRCAAGIAEFYRRR